MPNRVTKVGDSAKNRILVRIDTTKLDALEKQLKIRYAAQVGVLGGVGQTRLKVVHKKVKRGKNAGKIIAQKVKGSESPMTNAEIGLVHEKGSKSKNIPRRSFLLVPLSSKLPERLREVSRGILSAVVNKVSLQVAYEKLARLAEGIVLESFRTSGFGTWPALKRRKGTPLIDSGQLRRSISSRVVTK